MGADAYIVPGSIPRRRGDDSHKLTMAAVQTALDFVGNGVKPKPLIGFAGVHTSDIDGAYCLLDELPYSLEALYVQMTPLSPMTDSPGSWSPWHRFFWLVARRASMSSAVGSALSGSDYALWVFQQWTPAWVRAKHST